MGIGKDYTIELDERDAYDEDAEQRRNDIYYWNIIAPEEELRQNDRNKSNDED